MILVAVDGLSYQEAADVVGATAGTIASRVSRGREALRRSLGLTDSKGSR